MWIANPSSQWTCTTYSLPVSRRTLLYPDLQSCRPAVGTTLPTRTGREQLQQILAPEAAVRALAKNIALQEPVEPVLREGRVVRLVGMCRADFGALLRKQYDDYGRIIRQANIKAE